MRPDVKAWVVKAEKDHLTALALDALHSSEFYEATGFHAQQCVEKYVKAFLTLSGIGFPKIHDLAALLGLSAPVDAALAKMAADAEPLNWFAVAFRYPGAAPRKRDVRRAIGILRQLRSELRRRLGLRR